MRTAVKIIAWVWIVWLGLASLYIIVSDLIYIGLSIKTVIEVIVQLVLAIPAILGLMWANKGKEVADSPSQTEETTHQEDVSPT